MMKIANLVDTMWLARYHCPKQSYEQGSYFIGHEFKISHIQGSYEIIVNLSTFGNTTSNKMLERLHSVLGK